MKHNQGLKGILVLFVLVVLMAGYYYYSSNRHISSKEDAIIGESISDNSKVDTILSRDLKMDYPASPREVIELFSDITMCYHNEEYTEEELGRLSLMARNLFDKELQDSKSEETYVNDLTTEIEQFKEQKITIAGYMTSSAAAIENEKFSQDGYEWTRVYCSYELKRDGEQLSSDEIFLLRKDDTGCWKIYGWDLVDK